MFTTRHNSSQWGGVIHPPQWGRLIADRCELSPTAWETAKDIYDAYRDWCEANGEKAIGKRAFGLRLGERGLDPGKSGSVRLWRGIGLNVPT